MAKASLHTERSLTTRELDTIAIALQLLLDSDAGELEIARAFAGAPDIEILSDVDVRSLLYELSRCRTVTVCRSNE